MPPLCTWLCRDEQVFQAANVGMGAPERAKGLGSCARLVAETGKFSLLSELQLGWRISASPFT